MSEASTRPRIGKYADVKKRQNCVILIDYENTLKASSNQRKDMENIGEWLIIPLIKEEIAIETVVVFFPAHLIDNLPLRTYSNLHRFYCVICPPKYAGIKDKDTVDAKLDEFGRYLVDHDDVSDLVVVAGDGDYHSLAVYAALHGKRVTFYASEQNIANRLLDDPMIRVKSIFNVERPALPS